MVRRMRNILAQNSPYKNLDILASIRANNFLPGGSSHFGVNFTNLYFTVDMANFLKIVKMMRLFWALNHEEI